MSQKEKEDLDKLDYDNCGECGIRNNDIKKINLKNIRYVL